MTTVTPREAISQLVGPGDRVLLGTAAGAATTLQRALPESAIPGLHLYGGMQLGGYDFMEPVREGDWTYETWHVMPSVRDDIASGRVGFHLARGGAVPSLIERLSPDVFLTSVSPPQSDGTVSLGVSVSYAMDGIDAASRVIAEVNPEMPVTFGNTSVPVERFTALVDAETALPRFRAAEPGEPEQQIATHINRLLPDSPTIQIGIGGVPEALVGAWIDDPPPGLTLYGMGIEGMVDLLETVDRPGSFIGGEMLGGDRLYAFADRNPMIEQYPISEILSVPKLAAIPRFVSINGAIEVDLTGQVNSEWVGGRQISGPGGGFDFLDAASLSAGGVSIIGLRSTARGDSLSTIVSRLSPGAPVTIPRHAVQVIVTEYGVADLRGLDLRARAEALVSIAHPAHRRRLEGELADQQKALVQAGGKR